MKLSSKSGRDTIVIVRGSDGTNVALPNGTKVTALDNIGDFRKLNNKHTRPNDRPVAYDDELYFVDRDELA